jgi:hypothetical protein
MSTGRVPSAAPCILAPVMAGLEHALDAELKRLPEGPDSPFARMRTIHVARLVVIPALEGSNGTPVEPPQPYVLFAADVDGSFEELLSDLTERLPAECATIWGRCPSWPLGDNPAARRSFLRQHRVELGFTIAPYPGVSVAEVREALELRRRLARFAVDAQGMTPVALMEAWQRAFPPGHTRPSALGSSRP